MAVTSTRAAGKPLRIPDWQRGTIEQFLDTAIPAMRLQHWTIHVDFHLACEKGALATISEHPDSTHATIRLSQDFLDLPEGAWQQCIIHELMHCHLFEVQRLAEDTVTLLGSRKEAAMFQLAYTSAVERCVDQLADVVVDLIREPPA